MPLDHDLQSVQETRRLIERAAEAQHILGQFSQEKTDAIVGAMAEAARQNAEPLARLAVEETTYGVVADKIEKNLFSARDIYNAIKDLKTVGIIREDSGKRVIEIGVPVGVVAAIIPVTNPTSTAIFKALIAVKTRNAVVMSPHPGAVKCICESARVMREAAVKAGAPEGAIACLGTPTPEAIHELMHHRQIAIILATGGSAMVRAAYSSGKPALGVGPGNVPAYIHSSADVHKAVADIITGKVFDNGTICSSEQHIVIDQAVAEQSRAEAQELGGHFLNAQEAEAVARVLIKPNFRVDPKMVGQSAERIARAAGVTIPPHTRALIVPLEGVGKEHPLSAEKLSPVLSFHVVKDWREGIDFASKLLGFGGMGHTMSIHARDDAVIREIAMAVPAFRVVVNSPAVHGSIGYSTGLFPSMSLGCGTFGGNITTDNISPMNLLNIKRVAHELRPVTSSRPGATATPEPKSAVVSGGVHAHGGLQPDRTAISQIVERFLSAQQAAKTQTSAPPPPQNLRPLSSASAPRTTPASPGQTNLPEVMPAGPVPPASASPVSPRPVDFVSEEDVRVAIKQGQKIYVRKKTIITPSARDLGEPQEIFVIVQ
jgi:acetaldehyde dehydrogenase (acetylating)